MEFSSRVICTNRIWYNWIWVKSKLHLQSLIENSLYENRKTRLHNACHYLERVGAGNTYLVSWNSTFRSFSKLIEHYTNASARMVFTAVLHYCTSSTGVLMTCRDRRGPLFSFDLAATYRRSAFRSSKCRARMLRLHECLRGRQLRRCLLRLLQPHPCNMAIIMDNLDVIHKLCDQLINYSAVICIRTWLTMRLEL